MSTAALGSPVIQRSLGRAAVYQLLSLAFDYPDEDVLEELRAYLADVSEHPIASELDLGSPLLELSLALEGSNPGTLRAEHNRLFAGRVVCTAHESEHAFDPFSKSRQLADIAGFYRAFGLEVARDRRGLPDFIATELEFLGLLVRKEVYAEVQGWDDRAQLAERAVSAFLKDHLGRWVPSLCAAILEHVADPDGFFAATARLCQRFVAAELARAGVRPIEVLAHRRSVEDGASFVCPLVMARPDAQDPFGDPAV